jgi:hypothetical protein
VRANEDECRLAIGILEELNESAYQRRVPEQIRLIVCSSKFGGETGDIEYELAAVHLETDPSQ